MVIEDAGVEHAGLGPRAHQAVPVDVMAVRDRDLSPGNGREGQKNHGEEESRFPEHGYF
jgi:hypothetical protein